MLSLDECKKILNSNKTKFDNDEVKQIRDYLYLLASLEIEKEKTKENECNNIQ